MANNPIVMLHLAQISRKYSGGMQACRCLGSGLCLFSGPQTGPRFAQSGARVTCQELLEVENQRML